MNAIQTLFMIAFLGYLLGSISIFDLKLGASAVLLTALVFGHFGYEIPAIIRDFGLACFVGSVGFTAGPVFFRGFRKQAAAYVFLGITIILAGALTAVGLIKFFNLPVALGVGMMAGALTTTPGLAAAIEATGDSLASVGYGIAYPFGVIGVVLFVQLIPKFEKADLKEETKKLDADYEQDQSASELALQPEVTLKQLDPSGMLALTFAMVLGLFLSAVVIPLPGGAKFSFGISGGPLLAGLLCGHFGRIGNISLHVPPKALETLRELGLMLFLIGAGTGAGKGFMEVIHTHGIGLFLIGAVLTLVPMLSGYLMARHIFRLPLLKSLGAICGGMTSTPALGGLISLAKTDKVVASYAATYPVALILVVLACQIISLVL